MFSFTDLALHRESCRLFSDRPVSKETLLACLDSARLSPSACNSQPWHFTFCLSPESREKILPALQRDNRNLFASDAQALVVVSEIPAKLFTEKLPQQKFAQMDIGMTVSYFTLRAAELGLGTCILGWIDEDAIHSALSLPETLSPRLVLAVGYPAKETPREKKRNPAETLADFL